jgi:TolB protein
MVRRSLLACVVVVGMASLWAASGAAQRARAAAPDGGGALEVLVGPGGSGLEPMAVPDVRCVDGADDACRTVADVLRRDMTLSFMYEVIPPRSYLAPRDEPLDAPAWNDWTNVGARWLIKGEVRGSGPVDVDLRLYNAVERAPVAVREQSFRGVALDEVRAVVHRFCNGVLEARTGVPGVFDTRIAYSVAGGPGVKGIGLITMDGSERDGVVFNGNINTFPAWGAGGIIYTSFLDGKPDLWIGKRKLTRDAGQYRKVAVGAGRMVASISYGGQSDLYLLGADGSVQKNLTNSDADEVGPSISPDGGRVAYVSNASGGPQIHVMSIGGGGGRRLTHAGSYNYAPDWGRNGLIAFAAMEGGASDIFTVSEGGEIRRLTQNQGFNKDPSWSPDGRYVAFISSRPEGSGVWIMSADGRYQALVGKGGGYGNVAWQR